MEDATRFAVGIAVLLGAMIFLFFAFHPNGVNLTSENPAGMLKWLMDKFNNPEGSSGTTPASTGSDQLSGTKAPAR